MAEIKFSGQTGQYTWMYHRRTVGLQAHHHHLPPWIRSFDLIRHRRVAIFSWGVLQAIRRITQRLLDAGFNLLKPSGYLMYHQV
jgi:hypothetical protein